MKQTFAADTFAANTFASGAWQGTGTGTITEVVRPAWNPRSRQNRTWKPADGQRKWSTRVDRVRNL